MCMCIWYYNNFFLGFYFKLLTELDLIEGEKSFCIIQGEICVMLNNKLKVKRYGMYSNRLNGILNKLNRIIYISFFLLLMIIIFWQ